MSIPNTLPPAKTESSQTERAEKVSRLERLKDRISGIFKAIALAATGNIVVGGLLAIGVAVAILAGVSCPPVTVTIAGVALGIVLTGLAVGFIGGLAHEISMDVIRYKLKNLRKKPIG